MYRIQRSFATTQNQQRQTTETFVTWKFSSSRLQNQKTFLSVALLVSYVHALTILH